MNQASHPQRDPVVWCVVVTAAFMAIAWHGMLVPSTLYFDEIHYVPAARKLLALLPANREHPLVGKEILAASIALLGDRALAWRLPALLFGGLGLFAFARLVWAVTGRPRATIIAMLLLATNFLWFIQSRIAMLDIFAATLLVVALWQAAAALGPGASRNRPRTQYPVTASGAERSRVVAQTPGLPRTFGPRNDGTCEHNPCTPAHARVRFALAGLCLGLAMGAKWSVVPYLPLPGLACLALWLRGRREGVRALPLTLPECAFWLGVVPLGIYWATFAPALYYPSGAGRITPLGFVEQHRQMLALQESVIRKHQYQSVWYQWVANWRPIWYLYRDIEGAQRGILLLGNPFTMLAGLAAVLWCAWAAIRRRRADAAIFAGLYLAGLAFWIASIKPVQFYYHYLLPATFLMACLALPLDAAFDRGGNWRRAAILAVFASVALFAWFYPILSAQALSEGRMSYQLWMWLDSWR